MSPAPRFAETEEADELSGAVIGAAIEVHRILGPGFEEPVYEAALCIELTARKVDFIAQHIVRLTYKGSPVGEGRVDLLVAGALIVELKAVDVLAPVHTAQVISYLKATGLKRGLLINFDVALLKQGIKRISRQYPRETV